jgi:hypothetical protein
MQYISNRPNSYFEAMLDLYACLCNSDMDLDNKCLLFTLLRHHISFSIHTTAYKFVRNNTHYNPPGIDSLLQHAPEFISVHIKFHNMCLFVLLSTCRNSTLASNIVIRFYIL